MVCAPRDQRRNVKRRAHDPPIRVPAGRKERISPMATNRGLGATARQGFRTPRSLRCTLGTVVVDRSWAWTAWPAEAGAGSVNYVDVGRIVRDGRRPRRLGGVQ